MKKILVFKHMSSQNPGIFREFAESWGIEFFEIDLHAGDEIPDPELFDALWVMGGSMNVWEEDQYPWLAREKSLVKHAVMETKLPFLGVCLGHQLLAEAMGGKVEKSSKHEIGLFEINPTQQGLYHPLFRDLPDPNIWVNVHTAEVAQAPPGATILATSETCKNHVMQIGENAYSCQFHPEVCSHTVAEWMKIPGIPQALEDLLGADGVHDFKLSIENYLSEHNAAARQLFENWCGLVFQVELKNHGNKRYVV